MIHLITIQNLTKYCIKILISRESAVQKFESRLFYRLLDQYNNFPISKKLTPREQLNFNREMRLWPYAALSLAQISQHGSKKGMQPICIFQLKLFQTRICMPET